MERTSDPLQQTTRPPALREDHGDARRKAPESGGCLIAATLAQTRPIQVTGSPLPTHTEDAQNPAVGTAAPVLRGAGFDGTPVTIGGDGRATLVMFLAHRCPHCQRELPVLASGRRPP